MTASSPLLLFGVDDDDPIYTDGKILDSVFSDFDTQIEIFKGLQGRICKIWRLLAYKAYEMHDADFTCLLGDDVVLLGPEWQAAIEARFLDIAQQRNLPFGAACVSFLDESFKGFPTFPVVHKWHFKALGGTVLPSHFENQGGDPFIFELYKRFGASQFKMQCRLENTIGGRQSARYTKQRLRFEDDILILTTAINVFENLP